MTSAGCREMTETYPIDRASSRLDLKQRLLSFAREIGFDSCRVADCGSAPHIDEFRNWLDEGGHGEMSYMERGEEKRCDPQKVCRARDRLLFWR